MLVTLSTCDRSSLLACILVSCLYLYLLFISFNPFFLLSSLISHFYPVQTPTFPTQEGGPDPSLSHFICYNLRASCQGEMQTEATQRLLVDV